MKPSLSISMELNFGFILVFSLLVMNGLLFKTPVHLMILLPALIWEIITAVVHGPLMLITNQDYQLLSQKTLMVMSGMPPATLMIIAVTTAKSILITIRNTNNNTIQLFNSTILGTGNSLATSTKCQSTRSLRNAMKMTD